ncbi:hypothetical protein [Pseudomonas syringae]|uniref:hypothetical protein n=1 Tax=Pseudomonas syringae TaxID=317 RepID=UPI0032D989D7
MSLYANHEALQALSSEQLAELALYGLRYKALGAKNIDFNDPTRLDVLVAHVGARGCVSCKD